MEEQQRLRACTNDAQPVAFATTVASIGAASYIRHRGRFNAHAHAHAHARRPPPPSPDPATVLFPLELRFKILAIASQIYVRDANDTLVAYVRQKLFKLKEDVVVYGDSAQTQPLYRIRADRIIDFSAAYGITDAASGRALGTVKRRGMRSIWRAHYEISATGGTAYEVREESALVKVLDGLLGEIPVLGMFTGYFLHPAYRITRAGSEAAVMRIVKKPALFEGVFRLEAPAIAGEEEAELLVLGTLMILLLERSRG